MKKLLFALMMVPVVAWSNPFLGNCKTQYRDAYNVMMARQSNVPMYAMVDAIEKLEPKNNEILTDSDLTAFYDAQKESIKIIERAYTMPNFGFMDSAAHTMAAEFANHQYLRCTRAKRK